MSGTTWRFRRAETDGPGMIVPYPRLVRAIEEGVLGPCDEVSCSPAGGWTPIVEQAGLQDFLPATRYFRSRESDEAEMDMTPMIDVTFQLLIFFMIAATYVVQKTLEMAQADPNEQGAVATLSQLEKHNIIVKITADRTILVQNQPTPIDKLVDVLTAAVKAESKAELVIDAHDDVDHETIVRVVDAAGGAQIEKVHFVARASPQPQRPTGS